jgi:hypothetical protein
MPITNADSTHLLMTFVDRLHKRYASDLDSVVHFSLPFGQFQQATLAVLANSASDLFPAYIDAGLDLLNATDLVCLRYNELHQLRLPSPDLPMVTAPYWIRATGRVLWGRDVRHEIPCDYSQSRLLACQLDQVQSSRHRIINLLLNDSYVRLQQYLTRQRSILMVSALLERGIWQVYPITVQRRFTETFPDVEFQGNILEFNALRAGMRNATQERQKTLAYRGAWLFEVFLRLLWKHAWY